MKTKMPFDHAFKLAMEIRRELFPACERIEIAGSIRRRKPEVGDIELVAIPRLHTVNDFFGVPVYQASFLDAAVDKLVQDHEFRMVLDGNKFKQVQMPDCSIDLFITTPECWGIQFMLRTGSADFSHWMVTKKRYGGACPSHMQVKDGRLWVGPHEVETPEEPDVFEQMGVCYVAPEAREK